MRYFAPWLMVGILLGGCSGRYVVGAANGSGGDEGGSSSAGAPSGSSTAGHGTTQPAGGSTGTAGASSVAMGGVPAVFPPKVDEAACGVPDVEPAPIGGNINNSMLWWVRVSKLVWGSQVHEPPGDLPFPIEFEQAGQIADAAVDQAIAETKGIPGAALFVRDWMRLADSDAPLSVNWSAQLKSGALLEPLLTLAFDRTRRGALTEKAFLEAEQSISGRGATMYEALFGQPVPPEPPGLPTTIPPPGLTRREGLEQAVLQPVCSACHRMIDPLGYSLENYDSSGAYVTVDAGKPIDASGSCRLPSGSEIQFKDYRDLSDQLAQTCDANLGLVDRYLLFALEQAKGADFAPDSVHAEDRKRMRQAYMYNGRTLRSLIRSFAQSQAIRE